MKGDAKKIPLLDQEFLRKSLAPVDIEERRRFEELLIRYDLQTEPQVTQIVNNVVEEHIDQTVIIEGGSGCYWTKEGSNLVYYEGSVGVGFNSLDHDFGVKGNAIIQASIEAPYLEIRNWSDTAYDPMIKWALGAATVVKFVEGVDDSDSDKWKIANTSALGTLATSQSSYGERLIYYFLYVYGDFFDIDLDNFTAAPTASNIVYPSSIGLGDGERNAYGQECFDGQYLYYADTKKVQKVDTVSKTFIAKCVTALTPWGICYWNGKLYAVSAGPTSAPYKMHLYVIDAQTMTLDATHVFDQGSADDEFSTNRGMATDGTNLYICDLGNQRVTKTTMAGVFVAKTSHAMNVVISCEVDSNYVYVCNNGDPDLHVFNKSDMSLSSTLTLRTISGYPASPTAIAINNSFFYVYCYRTNYHVTIDKYDIATRTFQEEYVPTYLGYMSTVCTSLHITKNAVTGGRLGDLFVIHQDGQYIDAWPIVRVMDDIRFVEGGDVATGDYVGFSAPVTVTASYTMTLPAAVPTGQSHLSVSGSGAWSWGQDVNTTASPTFVALTLNQGSADDQILRFKSSDVAHGITTYEETDTYAAFSKASATQGGLKIRALTEGTTAWQISGMSTSDNTTKSTSGRAIVEVYGHKKSGTGVTDPGTNANIFGIFKSASPECLWLCDLEGDTWQAGAITATQGTFNIAGGTAPLVITSTTVCTNLNADLWDGLHKASLLGLDALADPNADRIVFWDDSETVLKWLAPGDSVAITATTIDAIQDIRTSAGPSFDHLHLTIATGTAPLVVASTTAVANLNADLVDGKHYTEFAQVHVHATDPPGVNDDVDNYREGCIWIEQDADKAYICVHNADGAAVWQEVGAGGGGGAFTDLTDVPASYATHGGKFVKVNGAENALEFVASSVAGHVMLSASHTDSTAAAAVAGDIIYADATPKWTRLAKGSNGDVLTLAAGLPSWAAPSGGSSHVLLSATHTDTLADTVVRGDILYGNATPKWARLAKGTSGYVLSMGADEPSWTLVPTHASRHASGGADAIKLDDLAATDDNTDLNASTTAHGLLKKLDNSQQNFMRGDGSWALSGGPTVILRELFDGLSLANINGQGSYTYFAAWAVTLSGTSSAVITDLGGSNYCLRLTGDSGATSCYAYLVAGSALPADLSHGLRVRVRMRTDDVSMGTKGFAIGTGTATPMCQIYFRNSATDQLTFWQGSTNTKILDVSDNTWYIIDLILFKSAATVCNVMVWVDGSYIATYVCAAHAGAAPWLYFSVYDNPSAAASDSYIDVDYVKLGHSHVVPTW